MTFASEQGEVKQIERWKHWIKSQEGIVCLKTEKTEVELSWGSLARELCG
jgi:hypothetical protein